MQKPASKKSATLPTPKAAGKHRVTEQIRELILSGELAPGSRISQESLAEHCGTSRIPVRDALARLENDGLVILKPNSGAWVAKLDLHECIESYKIRERLEPLALTESVPNLTQAQIEELQQMAEQMKTVEDSEEFLKLDRQFHLNSYKASGMSQLNPMIERFWNTTQHYRRAFTKLIGHDGTWIIHAEHTLMVEAIKRRDAEGAATILREHIRRTRVNLEKHSEIFTH